MNTDFYFTITDNCVMIDARFTSTERLVYWVLCKHANIKTKTCRVYLKTIAKEVACCVKTVQRALKKLLEKGVIFIETCFMKNGSKAASKYTIIGKEAECYKNFVNKSSILQTNFNDIMSQEEVAPPMDTDVITPMDTDAIDELTTRCQNSKNATLDTDVHTSETTCPEGMDTRVLLINNTINNKNINNKSNNYPYGVSEAYQVGMDFKEAEKENEVTPKNEAEKSDSEKVAENETLKPLQEQKDNFEVKGIFSEEKSNREPFMNEYEEKSHKEQVYPQHENLKKPENIKEPETCTLEDVPAAMKETAEFMLFKTGRKNFTFDEISALKKLLVIHYPARVQREITKVVDRFTKKNRSLATITFSYIYEALKNQRSFFGFKKQSAKQPAKTENPGNLTFALDSYESNSPHFSEDDLKRLEANLL